MSPNSSISASDRRSTQYLVILSAVAACVLLLNMVTSLYAIRTNLLTWHVASLFKYQTDKLKSGPTIDLLLLGDSSLGNAIDARVWSAQSGAAVVNVALTGAYGYAGSLQMLRRASNARGVRAALIVQTPDILARGAVHEGIIFTAGDLSAIFDVPIQHLLPWLLSKEIPISLMRRIVNGPPRVSDQMKRADYVPQSGKPMARSEFDHLKPFDAASIRQESMLYLRRISELCAAKRIRCGYAYGPVAAPLCSDEKGYYTEANRLIRATGLELLSDRPPCLNQEELGDSPDHVSPSHKLNVTALYIRMYSAWIQRIRKAQ